MMKVTGTGGPSGARGPRPSGGARPAAAGAFRIEGPNAAGAAAGAGAAGEAASASALGALIALQADERRKGARHQAMAERLLMLLERLRDGLVAGRVSKADLQSIADAATAKLDDPDERIGAIYAEIALRARVELAKLGA